MLNPLPEQFDRANALFGFLVLAGVFVVYNLTKAPTLSFWDCGEFIAAASSMGIPHPPGSPLFIMIGRLFSIIPMSDDIAIRINLVSAISNSFTALFIYLTLARLLKLWFERDRSSYTKLLIYGGSVSGALMAAFGLTQWTNSVEAEVYGLMMVMLSAAVWLAMIYYENQGRPSAERIMILIVFIAFLGIGVHLSVFLILPIASLLFVMRRETPTAVWFGLAGLISLELYLIFAMSSRPDEVPLFVPALIGFLVYLFFVFSFEKIPRGHLYQGSGLMLATVPSLSLLWSTESSLNVILDGIGWLGLSGAGLYALYRLYVIRQSGNGKNKNDSDSISGFNLAPSIIVIVTVFMTIVLALDFSGYKNFLYLSGGLVLALGWFIKSYIRWTFLIALLAVSLVVLGVWEFFYGMIAAIPIILILGLGFRLRHWRTALCIIVVAAAGYSVHTFIMVRSTQNPMIDQNKASRGLTVTINFLERKQYGSQSMVERMFSRRAEWKSQFGYFQRMGFWKFFSDQWGLTNQRFLILLLLGMYGLWELIRKRPKPGLTLLVLLLACSIGLVLYMNFADGLRQEALAGRGHIEVRDRDYFFTPFFVFFGMAIGLGGTLLIQYVREFTASLNAPVRKTILAVLPVILLLPGVALAANYYQCDRSENYMPYEYARNILMSCDPDAVLFTGGDNDTFPVWALQATYGYRTDVAVVCLPLANTNWYAKQMRDYYGLDLGMTDEQIDNLRPFRLPDGKAIRIQEQISTAIIVHNADKRPINFCITTGPNAQKLRGESLDSMLVQVGMVLKLDPTRLHELVDVDRSIELFTGDSGFSYKSYNDSQVFKDAASLRSANNMAQAAMVIADNLRRSGETAKAELLVREIVESLPTYGKASYFLAATLSDLGRLEEVRQMADTATIANANELGVIYARGLRRLERNSEAEIYLLALLQRTPDYRSAFEELTRLYIRSKSAAGLQELFIRWLEHNPEDSEVRNYLMQMQKPETKSRQEDTVWNE